MSELEIIEYYIRCAFCNNTKMLKEAALEGWEICSGCQLVFCLECKRRVEEDICPGSAYTTKHKVIFGLLPLEQIIGLADEMQKKPKEGKYISKIFFEDEKKKIELLKKKKDKSKINEYEIIRFREEQWRKFGTVLVKRKDGKFLTWGQIE